MLLIKKYAKGVISTLAAAVGALIVAVGTTSTGDIGDIDTTHWLLAVLTVLGSGALVALVENIPGVAGGIIKTALATLSAGIASLVVALDDDVISQAEWLTALVTAVTATGLVYQISNLKPAPAAVKKTSP